MYNRCTGIYKFGNSTYPRRIRRRSNLGHIFRGGKVRLVGRDVERRLYSMHLFGAERYRLSYSLLCSRARDCRDIEGENYGSGRLKDTQRSEKLAGERESRGKGRDVMTVNTLADRPVRAAVFAFFVAVIPINGRSVEQHASQLNDRYRI